MDLGNSLMYSLLPVANFVSKEKDMKLIKRNFWTAFFAAQGTSIILVIIAAMGYAASNGYM